MTARAKGTDAAAPAIVAYTGNLADLRAVLEAEARDRPGRWARRRVRSGAVISMRNSRVRRAAIDGEWRLAIARDLAPSTLTEKARFEAEIADITRAFAITWRRGDDVFSAEGSIAAVFGTP